MKQHPLILVAIIAVLAVGSAIALSVAFSRDVDPPPPTEQPRLISLMPPVTETLYEIGAGDQLVGRSEWCNFPPEAAGLPKCGSALTPNTEQIVRLRPTLILANSSKATARDDLSGLAHSEFMPWLTAEEMIASTRKLGELTGHVAEANKLADDLAAALMREPDPNAPTVLLVMLPEPGKLDPVSFLRRNSVHGRMLTAAGGRNAVDEDVSGVPTISMERVIELDPSIIILVGIDDELDPAVADQILYDWRRIEPLKAVRRNRIGIVHGQHFYGAGRRLLRAVDELRAEINRLEAP